jgi:FSR family fosmidomycin resistance protein-like MFS transporter
VRPEIDKRAMALLSAGHLTTDFATGAVPALVPFFVAKWNLSYTLAGLTILASSFSSSVVQPLFGLVSDRRGALWLLPAGLVLGGVGLGLGAAAPSYWLALALIVVAGLGSAAFHPEGSKLAAYVSGRRRASGMSFFSVGGNVGYAIGPLTATSIAVHFGLGGWALLLALPPLVLAAVLLAARPYLRSFVPARGAHGGARGENQVGAAVLLLAAAVLRSAAWFGLLAFVPLWEVAKGHSEAHGNRVLAVMLLVGGIGTLAIGALADRYGRRPVFATSIGLVGPLIAVYLAVGGAAGTVALAGVGLCVIGTFGLTMVMSQEYLPRHIGMASGLAIGLAMGLGGAAALGLGALADATSLKTALWVCAAAPVAALVLSTRLPSSDARLVPEIATP